MNENLPAIRQSTTPSIPSEHEMMVYHTMAEQAVSSKMYRGIGEKSGVMMIMLAARELGILPMQALNGGLNIINGKVELSAKIMGALIRKAGHIIETKISNAERCVLIGKRGDTEESQEVSFTLEEAKTAGLVKPGGGWIKWPSDMCYARALSRLSRRLFSDVVGMGYVEGEISCPKASKEAQSHDTQEVYADNLPVMEYFDPLEQCNENGLMLTVLLEKFKPEDKELVLKYIASVSIHFGWTANECINKFLEEKDIIEKFEKWKSKKQKEDNAA